MLNRDASKMLPHFGHHLQTKYTVYPIYNYLLDHHHPTTWSMIILFECFIKNKIEIQSKSSSACLSSSNRLSAPIVKNTCVHKVVLLLRLLQSFYLSELWRFVTSWIEALFSFHQSYRWTSQRHFSSYASVHSGFKAISSSNLKQTIKYYFVKIVKIIKDEMIL